MNHPGIQRNPEERAQSIDGIASAVRIRDLFIDDIKQLLREGPVQFVVAQAGQPAKWMPVYQRHVFWKTEVIQHTVDAKDTRCLEEFPDEYAYWASLWNVEKRATVVLLERVDA